ncbi:histidine kinase [Noviherbaspirillum aridicola]|uniref:histidine kinase n=1 Tax=Noviherbaspirillum aridicola TaxID=2849687 RepID=A0ABQ4Q432_9BURK|nr:histidine kinase [Noviherbaspirillum aridicola]
MSATPSPRTEPMAQDQLFRLLVHGVVDYAIFMLTPDGTVNSWNAGAQRIKGYQESEIIGQHFSRFYREKERLAGDPERALATALREGRYESEGWRVRKDGTEFWANAVLDVLHDPEGRFIGYAKVTRDLTERRIAREALDASEQRFRLLVQGVTDYAIYMLDPDGIISNWNYGAQRIKGYPEADVIGTHFSRFYTEEDRAAGEPRRALDIAASTGKYEREGWRVRRDGTRFMASVLIQPIRDERNQLVGFSKITRDITEKRKAEEQLEKARVRLAHAQRLEAIGKLTGGVAHDFNNALQIIGGNLQLLQPRVEGDEQARRHLALAQEGVERGTRLSSQLLAFARRQPLQPRVTNLARLMRAIDALLRRALGDSISIHTHVADDLWNTLVDPSQLENVILNIALNSRDAMGGDGQLTIELGNAMLAGEPLVGASDVVPGDYVMLAITDTGCGMSPEVLDRVFEPFYTTKAEGEGTGLGLSMAYGFVQQSGGQIKIYSEPGHGTTVRIYLPRSLEQEEEAPARSSGPVVGGDETVLVVEDDPRVQLTVVEMLAGLGYRVLKADDAQAALSIIRSGLPVDLMFTDVVMPGPLRSTDMVRQARRHQPTMAVLFTSGYTQNAIVHGGRLDPGIELLSKPYRREDLARKVREMLSARAERVRAEAADKRRILVVDDNDDLRLTVCQLLEALGYAPHGVGSAEAALEELRGGEYGVLLTDVMLPGMSGIELARLARGQMPSLRLIIASGAEEARAAGAALQARLLRKPFDLSALQAALAP